MNPNITQQRAAQRFAQIAMLEQQLQKKAQRIVTVQADLKAHKEEYDGLLARLRTAARDEGELPLFDLDGE